MNPREMKHIFMLMGDPEGHEGLVRKTLKNSAGWYEKLSKTVPVSAVLNNYWKNAMYGRNSSFSLKLMESIAVGVFGWNYSAQQWIRKVYM